MGGAIGPGPQPTGRIVPWQVGGWAPSCFLSWVPREPLPQPHAPASLPACAHGSSARVPCGAKNHTLAMTVSHNETPVPKPWDNPAWALLEAEACSCPTLWGPAPHRVQLKVAEMHRVTVWAQGEARPPHPPQPASPSPTAPALMCSRLRHAHACGCTPMYSPTLTHSSAKGSTPDYKGRWLL